MPCAFITGAAGQDGSYLAELLRGKKYEVIAPGRAECDVTDAAAVGRALRAAAPDEVYHLAAVSHVGQAAQDPAAMLAVNFQGTVNLIHGLREDCPRARLFFASSSEVFGRPDQVPQNEETPFAPVTIYGESKARATLAIRQARADGLFAASGILYNHESPRRGEVFVTRKICRAVAAIKAGRQQDLSLGDTTARRDWGDARDYVLGMWLALQHPQPEDFVFATGELHSVQDVVEIAFATAQLDWRGHVRVDASLMRPAEPARLVGDASKARRLLGWSPRASFRSLIEEMTRAELA